MTVFASEIQINKSASDLFSFLEDLNNHQKLMPDSGYNWSFTQDEAQLEIQNLATLSLKVSEKKNPHLICIRTVSDKPVPVTIRWQIDSVEPGMSSVNLNIDAKLNMMMKMLVSASLEKLVEYQINKLKEIIE